MFGKLAGLFVDIQAKTDKFDAGIAHSKGVFTGFSAMVTASSLAVAAGLAALGYGAYKAVTSASDLNETLSKTDAVLGDSAEGVKKFADEMAEKFGLVKRETLDAAVAFGGLGKGLGKLSGGELTEFSTKFTKMAADLSSFANMDMSTATQSLMVGLSGEQSDELKKLGIIMNETTIKNYAMSHGIKEVNGSYTEQQKIMIRSALLTQGLADANGDLERTSGGFANQSRKLWGNLQNTLTDVGMILMPFAARVLSVFNALTSGISAWVTANKDSLTAWFESLAGWFSAGLANMQAFGVGVAEVFATMNETFGLNVLAVMALGEVWKIIATAIGQAVAGIGVLMRNFATIFQIGVLFVKQGATNIVEAVGWFVGAVGQYLQWFGANWTKVFADVFSAGIAILKNFISNVMNNLGALWDWIASWGTTDLRLTWTPLLDGFKATMDELPDIAGPVFSSLQGEINALGAKMMAKELIDSGSKAVAASVAKSGATNATKKPAAGAEGAMAKAVESKFMSLESFAKDIQSAALGKGGEAKRTADAAEKMVVEQRRTTKAIERNAGRSGVAVAG